MLNSENDYFGRIAIWFCLAALFMAGGACKRKEPVEVSPPESAEVPREEGTPATTPVEKELLRIARETLREQTAANTPVEVFRKVIDELAAGKKIKASGDTIASSTHSKELTPDEMAVRQNLLNTYNTAGYQVPILRDAMKEASSETALGPDHARKIFQLLVNEREMVKVTEDFYLSRESIERLVRDVRVYAETIAENRLIGVPEFKEVAGVSRKYAIPLLEYLDGEGITRRAGNQRIVL